MHPHLAKLEHELTAAIFALDASQTQLRLPGNLSSWTIHQIVQHLLLTYDSTISSIEGRLAKGRPTLSRSTAGQRVARFVVVTMGLMPGRHLAPPEVTPTAPETPVSGESLSLSFSNSLTQLDRLLIQAGDAFGTVPCLTHFALGPLSSAQWRRFHLNHGRHHVRQILSILRANGL